MGDWIRVLRQQRTLPADVIVPGHGEPQHDGRYVDLLTRLFQSTLSQAETAVAAGKDLEATRASIKLDSLRQEFARGNPIIESGFDRNYVAPAVERAWRE